MARARPTGESCSFLSPLFLPEAAIDPHGRQQCFPHSVLLVFLFSSFLPSVSFWFLDLAYLLRHFLGFFPVCCIVPIPIELVLFDIPSILPLLPFLPVNYQLPYLLVLKNLQILRQWHRIRSKSDVDGFRFATDEDYDAEAELEEGGEYEHAFGGGIEESEQQVAKVESARCDAQTTRSY